MLLSSLLRFSQCLLKLELEFFVGCQYLLVLLISGVELYLLVMRLLSYLSNLLFHSAEELVVDGVFLRLFLEYLA
jgi:hypothetical protein